MSRRLVAWCLFAVIGAAMLLSLRWAFLVPVLESPDETTHLDYVLCAYEGGGILRIKDRPVAVVPKTDPLSPTVHPMTWYLSARTLLPMIRFHPEMRIPADYGTPGYLDKLEAQARPYAAPPTRNPFYLDKNPFGYYALTALWLGIIGKINDGIVFLFFSARIFSVLLLAVGLIATYFAVRVAGWPRLRSLAFTAAIAFFPLTSFVSSYIQPDNFALAAVSFCFYAFLRLRTPEARESDDAAWLLAGLAWGCLFLTKYHFFAAVSPGLIALLFFSELTRPAAERRWLRRAVLLAAPVLLFALIQFLWVGPMSTQYHVEEARRWQAATPDWPQSRLSQIWLALKNFYDDRIFETFWGVFGWVDTPLVIGSAEMNRSAQLAVRIGTRVALGLAVIAMVRAAFRVLKIARKRSWLQSARLAFGDPILTSIVTLTVLMVVLFITTPVAGEGQGRHWYALLPAIFWLGTEVASRVTRNRRLRRTLAWLFIACLLSYDAIAGVYAVRSVSQRYYGIPDARGVEPGWFFGWLPK